MSHRNRRIRAWLARTETRAGAWVTAVSALILSAVLVGAGAGAGPARAAGTDWARVGSARAGGGMRALVAAAKAEGSLNVIGLPGTWAGYRVEIRTFERRYGIRIHSERPHASSSAVLGALERSGSSRSAPDVIDIGQAYTGVPGFQSLVTPYRVATWRQIPAADKDPGGDWFDDYYGYISFGCDTTVVPSCPTSWAALESSQYRGQVTLNGAIGSAAPATDAVYAAAVNLGGSLADVLPGITFFKLLESDGNLDSIDCDRPATIEAHRCPILIDWDYLNTAKFIGLAPRFAATWKVAVPTGQDFAGYDAQAINARAPHPAAARLWEEFLYSTQGQNIWLAGGARPVELPYMVRAGTEDKAAYRRLPPVTGPPAAPTAAQEIKAGATIAAAFPGRP